MQLLVDIGNTRTKWVLAEHGHMRSDVHACLNAQIASAGMADAAQTVDKIYIANVAGNAMQHTLLNVLQHITVPIHFVTVTSNAGGLSNGYAVHQLGVDRWLALLAAFAAQQASCLVVNAGTAITIDALRVQPSGQQAQFIGGLIMPGLTLMRSALSSNTAQLNVPTGQVVDFPTNTQDAIYSGCISAVMGAIQQQWQLLCGMTGELPALLLSGGDAELIARYLPPALASRAVLMDNLVLHGLMQLEKHNAERDRA